MGLFSGIGKMISGGIGSLIAPVAEGIFSQNAADRTRDFQRDQRATQYQTAVADLRKAGLNPIIAAGGPSTAMPGATAPTPSFGQSYASARQAQLASAQMAQIRATTEKEATQAELNKVTAGLTAAQIGQVASSIKQLDASTVKMLAEAGLTQQQIDSFGGVLRGGGTISEAARALGFTGTKLKEFLDKYMQTKGQ